MEPYQKIFFLFLNFLIGEILDKKNNKWMSKSNLHFELLFSLFSCPIHQLNSDFPTIMKHSSIDQPKPTMTNHIRFAKTTSRRM